MVVKVFGLILSPLQNFCGMIGVIGLINENRRTLFPNPRTAYIKIQNSLVRGVTTGNIF